MHASSVRRSSGKKILGHKLRKGTGGIGEKRGGGGGGTKAAGDGLGEKMGEGVASAAASAALAFKVGKGTEETGPGYLRRLRHLESKLCMP